MCACPWILIVWIQSYFVYFVVSLQNDFKDMSISFYDDIDSSNFEQNYVTYDPKTFDYSGSINNTMSLKPENINYETNKTRIDNNEHDTVVDKNETALNNGTTLIHSDAKWLINTMKSHINKTRPASIIQNKTSINENNNYTHENRRYMRNSPLSKSKEKPHVSTNNIRRDIEKFRITPFTRSIIHKSNHRQKTQIMKYLKSNKINKRKPIKSNNTQKTRSSRLLNNSGTSSFLSGKPLTSHKLKIQSETTKKDEKPIDTKFNKERAFLASQLEDLKNLLRAGKDYIYPETVTENGPYLNYNALLGEHGEIKHDMLVPNPEVITEANNKDLNNVKSSYSDNIHLNPDFELSYSYPKENIFDVVAKSGINFRISNGSSEKPQHMNQATIDNILVDIKPEMLNDSKNYLNNSDSKPRKLDPKPKIVTYNVKLSDSGHGPKPNITNKAIWTDLDSVYGKRFKSPKIPKSFYFNNQTPSDDIISSITQNGESPTKTKKPKIHEFARVKILSETPGEEFKIVPVRKQRTPKDEHLRKQNTILSTTTSTQVIQNPLIASKSPISSNTPATIIPEIYYDSDTQHHPNMLISVSRSGMQEPTLIKDKVAGLISVSHTNMTSRPVARMTVASNVTTTKHSENQREHWWTPNLVKKYDPFKYFGNYSYEELSTAEEINNTSSDKLTDITRLPSPFTLKLYKTSKHERNVVKVSQTKVPLPPPNPTFKGLLEAERKRIDEGHFTYFVYKFMEYISIKKPPSVAKELLDQLLFASQDWYRVRPTMYKLGEPFNEGVNHLFTKLQQENPEILQHMAVIFKNGLRIRHEIFSPELNFLFGTMDKIYTQDEINRIYGALKDVKNYPNTTKTAKQVISHVLEEAFVEPFHRLGPTKRRHKLVENLNIYVAYTFYDGQRIFIPGNALRRNIDEEASVDTKTRKQMKLRLNLGNINIGESRGKMLIMSIRKKLQNAIENSEEQKNLKGEDKSDVSNEAVEKELKAKLNPNVGTETLNQFDKDLLRHRSTIYKMSNDETQLTRKQKHKNKPILPNLYLENSKTNNQNTKPYDSLSFENLKYINGQGLHKQKDKLLTPWNSKQPKPIQKYFATKNLKYTIKKGKPKEHRELNTEEFLQVVKKGENFNVLLKPNKKDPFHQLKIPKQIYLGTKSQETSKHLQLSSKQLNNKFTLSESSHKKLRMNGNKKPLVGQYHSEMEVYKKKEPKNQIRKQRKGKFLTKDIKLNKMSKALIETLTTKIMKRINLFKKHIKLRIWDHTKQETTTLGRQLPVQKITVKKNIHKKENRSKYLKKPYLDFDLSDIARQANQGGSDSYWHPPESYIDVDNDTSSIDREAFEHLLAKMNRINESRKAIGVKKNTIMQSRIIMGRSTRNGMSTRMPITLSTLNTPSKIIKQFQVEIFKTKVPYTGLQILREHNGPNKYLLSYQKDLNRYKYLKTRNNKELPTIYIRNTQSPKRIVNKKTRINKYTNHERKLELFNAFNSGSVDSLTDDSEEYINTFRRKINYESSYSDQEPHLKANLEDALVHGSDKAVNRRMLDADIDEEHAKLNLRMLSPSRESDEEQILKSNIYKSISFGGDHGNGTMAMTN